MRFIDLVLTSKIIISGPPPPLNVNWRIVALKSIYESPLNTSNSAFDGIRVMKVKHWRKQKERKKKEEKMNITPIITDNRIKRPHSGTISTYIFTHFVITLKTIMNHYVSAYSIKSVWNKGESDVMMYDDNTNLSRQKQKTRFHLWENFL